MYLEEKSESQADGPPAHRSRRTSSDTEGLWTPLCQELPARLCHLPITPRSGLILLAVGLRHTPVSLPSFSMLPSIRSSPLREPHKENVRKKTSCYSQDLSLRVVCSGIFFFFLKSERRATVWTETRTTTLDFTNRPELQQAGGQGAFNPRGMSGKGCLPLSLSLRH